MLGDDLWAGGQLLLRRRGSESGVKWHNLASAAGSGQSQCQLKTSGGWGHWGHRGHQGSGDTRRGSGANVVGVGVVFEEIQFKQSRVVLNAKQDWVFI